jgi:hypothetical protein
MRNNALALLLVGLPVTAFGVETVDFGPLDLSVPDGDPNGLAVARTVTSSFDSLFNLRLNLTLAPEPGGSWLGDLYVTLTHDSGFSVLMNRPGTRAGSVLGYGDEFGLSVTFSDTAAGDIHNYRSILNGSHDVALTDSLMGTWQPDGRDVDPDLVDATSPRTASLGSFEGLDPNGTWTLFVADVTGGGGVRLTGWSIEYDPIPEPSTGWAAGGALAALLVWRWRCGAKARG